MLAKVALSVAARGGFYIWAASPKVVGRVAQHIYKPQGNGGT